MDAAVVATEMTGTRPEHTAGGDAADPFGGRDLEPSLLVAVTLGGVTLAWGSGAGRGAWTAVVRRSPAPVTCASSTDNAWLNRL